MSRIGIRLPDNLHVQLKAAAEAQEISISDFVRNSVEQALNDKDAPRQSNVERQAIVDQLKEKDVQIERLHQLVAMGQSNTSELTKQLDRAYIQIKDQTLLIEDLRQPKSLWTRLFNREKKLEAEVTQ